MKLIVGLGNPGKEYRETRHNTGFIVVDNFLGKVSWKSKHEASIYIGKYGDTDVIFIKPLTYMNLSGLAVSKVVKFYNIDINDILVIQDDLDMELGTYKLKKNSSSGGHNGIKSIISELGTDEFARLKIGIGKDATVPTEKYVVLRFSTPELKQITDNTDNFNSIITSFIENGIEKTMEKYN